MLEKTYSTFYVTNIVIQQQYRAKGFKKYFELIFCLLVTKQNNEKNHETRPTGSTPFPKLNEVRSQDLKKDRDRGKKYDHEPRENIIVIIIQVPKITITTRK